MTENPSTSTDAAQHESGAAQSESDTRQRESGAASAGGGFETLVREGEAVAASCPYCDRPFAAAAARDLHVGEAHEAICLASEHEAYEAAFAAEDEELFYFHLKVVAALAVLYTVVVLAYMMALGGGYL